MFLTAGISNVKFNNIIDSDVYSPAVEKLEESSFLQRHFNEKCMDVESNQESDDSCISFPSKESSSVGLETPFIRKKLPEGIKESVEFSYLHKRTNFEDSKATKSPLVNFHCVYYIKKLKATL